MKIKVPNPVRAGVHEMRVFLKHHIKIDDSYDGYTHFRTQEIAIEECLPDGMRMQTFLHEIVHIIDVTYKCNLGEENVERLSQGLAAFLRDNLSIELDWSDIPEVKP